jgi:hypothetical protein
MYFISFCSILTRVASYILLQRRKETRHAYEVIAALEAQFNGSFDAPTRKKIAASHGVYNPLVIDAFCSMHGRMSNEHERKKLVYYFTCSSLLDNFFDRGELTSEQVNEICFRTTAYKATTFDEKAFIHCHSYLLDHIEDKAGYLQVLEAEIKAQEASMRQFRKDIPAGDIEAIMKAKGGNAVLLCRYYLDLPATEAEDRCWYQLGVIIQLNNDLYDIYKDINDGIETLATRCTNAVAMEQYVQHQVSLMKQLVDELPVSLAAKQRFSVCVAGVCASGRVAVDQLKRLQGKEDHLPGFNQFERKQLIVDMEKPGNILRWLKYAYRYGRI